MKWWNNKNKKFDPQHLCWITHAALSYVCDYQDINISFLNNQDYCRCRHSVTALLSVLQQTHQSFTLKQRGGECGCSRKQQTDVRNSSRNRFLRTGFWEVSNIYTTQCWAGAFLKPDPWRCTSWWVALHPNAPTVQIAYMNTKGAFSFCIRDLGLRSLFYYLKFLSVYTRNCQIRSYTKGVKLQVVVKTLLSLLPQYFLLFCALTNKTHKARNSFIFLSLHGKCDSFEYLQSSDAGYNFRETIIFSFQKFTRNLTITPADMMT